jgi:hypothetical protein
MTDQVTELPAGDIQRGGNSVSAGGLQPQSVHAAPEPMSEAQGAAIEHINQLRREAMDPALDRHKRDAIVQKMSELSKHAFLQAKAPAWYGEAQPDARATSLTEYDPLGESLAAAASATLTPQEYDQLVMHGKNQGLDAEGAKFAADFATRAGLDRVTARVITDRIVRHVAEGWGIEKLTQADYADLRAESVQMFGSEERMESEAAMALAYVEHVGLSAWVDKYADSLMYDPRVLGALAYKARCLGLKPK